MFFLSFVASLLSALILASSANAYIDMGTGSYLIQIIIASLLTVGVGIKVFWRKIKSLFSQDTAKKEQESD
jgi:hypothetical protein